MNHRITLRISDEYYQELKKEAHQKRMSISQITRNYIAQSLLKETAKDNEKNTGDDFSPHSEKPLRESHPLLIETVLLLREICIQRDAQILMKVDIELDSLLGEQRKRIYDE